MNFDFDKMTDRRGTGSSKWDVPEGVIPLSIADMDFECAPAIRRALEERIRNGIYGYTDIGEEWYSAYIGWWQSRHGFTMKRGGLVFATGVVPAISSAVRKLTTPAEKVLLLTPVYNIFFNSILNNGRLVLECPLLYNSDCTYSVDFGALEAGLADPQTSLMILCNPHNPVGKIWDRETLAKIGELAANNGVTVLSDEIHCDITLPGRDYIPFASVSDTCREISVTCISPTKTFSIPGLQTAAVYAENKTLRHKMWRALNTDEVAEPNVLAAIAPTAAFTGGAEWLDGLREYLRENREIAEKFIKSHIPCIKITPADATYLMWLNVAALGGGGSLSAAAEEHRLILCPGSHYGEGGRDFVRVNIATPRKRLLDGLARLARAAGAGI